MKFEYTENHEDVTPTDTVTLHMLGQQAVQSPDIADVLGAVDTEAQYDALKLSDAFSDSLESAIDETRELFWGKLVIEAPTLEDIISSKVDLRYLSEASEWLKSEGYAPEVVLSPVLNPRRWKGVFKIIAEEYAKNVMLVEPLWMPPTTENNWLLMEAPHTQSVRIGGPFYTQWRVSVTSEANGWFTYSDQNSIEGERYMATLQKQYPNVKLSKLHPDIHAYLAQQIGNVVKEGVPNNVLGQVWLYGGAYMGGKAAANYDSVDKTVMVMDADPATAYRIRPTFWG